MKRVGNIWDRFCSMDNAVAAIYRGTENKRSDSVVRRVFGYTDNLPEHYGKLQPEKTNQYAKNTVTQLEAGMWHHRPGKKRTIKSGGKTRDIEVASLHDHIIQWMSILAIEDILLKKMYYYSCGNLPKRGIEFARKNVERWTRSGDCKYFVKLDIRHFYNNIDLDRSSATMHRIIKDRRFLTVIDEIIYTSAAEDDQDGVLRNMAIGYYSSSWFANIYLDALDKFITGELYKTRRGKRVKYAVHYLRNVDDLLLMGTSKSDLKKAVRRIIEFCKVELGLEIKPCWEISRIGEHLPKDERGKRKIKPGTKMIDIIGYCFSTTHTVVRDRNFLRTRRLAKRVSRRLLHRGIVFLQNAQALVSLVGWFKHADSVYFYKTYIDSVVDIKFIKEVISYADKNRIGGASARIYCGQRSGNSGYHILYGCTGGAL